jgi:hypothetical protein
VCVSHVVVGFSRRRLRITLGYTPGERNQLLFEKAIERTRTVLEVYYVFQSSLSAFHLSGVMSPSLARSGLSSILNHTTPCKQHLSIPT